MGTYIRLVDIKNAEGKEQAFLRAAAEHNLNQKNDIAFEAEINDFSKIPGSPIAYWVSENLLNCFSNDLLGAYGEPKQGFATGDNARFLRIWHEVSIDNVGFGMHSRDEAIVSNKKWFPCNKGGSYRKWYGNNDIIAEWKNDGYEMTNFSGAVIRNPQYYFRDGLTWSTIANELSVRYSPIGFVFETKGSVCFIKNDNYKLYFLGLLNSKQIGKILLVLSPTLDFHEGPMARVPGILDENYLIKVTNIVQQNIDLCRTDWDSFETSWDFKNHPLLSFRDGVDGTILQACVDWRKFSIKHFEQLKSNEEELNRIFIEIYGLQDELTPEVEDKDITIRKADLTRDIKSLISYAVGCIFGRYSIYKDGLQFAGGNFGKEYTEHPEIYHMAVLDNCLVITEEQYFERDLAIRVFDFIREVYGANTLEENLDFIARTLNPNSKLDSRGTIRNYLFNDFYADHVKIYKKRPIYWQFDSGKQGGFRALMYLHRYDHNTIPNMRIDYLHELQARYENQIERLRQDIIRKPNEKIRLEKQLSAIVAKLDECRAYDQIVSHAANLKIRLALDDGVKVNYQKLQLPEGRLLTEIKL